MRCTHSCGYLVLFASLPWKAVKYSLFFSAALLIPFNFTQFTYTQPICSTFHRAIFFFFVGAYSLQYGYRWAVPWATGIRRKRSSPKSSRFDLIYKKYPLKWMESRFSQYAEANDDICTPISVAYVSFHLIFYSTRNRCHSMVRVKWAEKSLHTTRCSQSGNI